MLQVTVQRYDAIISRLASGSKQHQLVSGTKHHLLGGSKWMGIQPSGLGDGRARGSTSLGLLGDICICMSLSA